MRVALSLNDTFDEVLDDALWAESAGIDTIALPDHLRRAHAENPALTAPAPAPEPFIQLAAIAMATKRIELATLLSPITFRHPAILLKAAIELSNVSHGRFTLGLGTGYRLEEHQHFGLRLPSLGERYALLDEALGYVSAGRDSPSCGYAGTRYRMSPQEISPRADRLRLMVGGGGATKTPALAGRRADEYNSFVADPAALAARIRVARTAFAEEGRPGRLVVSIAAPLIVGDTSTQLRQEARRQARRRGLSTDDYLGQQRSGGTALIGSSGEVAERLTALAETGVDRCYFVFDGAVDREGVLAVRAAIESTSTHRPQNRSNRENPSE